MKDPDLLAELRIDPAQRDGAGKAGRGWWYAGGVALVAVLIGAGVIAVRPAAVMVETATAQAPSAVAGAMAVLDATGYVTARREATVSSKVTGKLAEVLIEEGDQVVAGQVLARLDAIDEQTQLRLAQAQLDAIRSQVGQLEAELQQAERDHKRQTELNARGLTPAQALDDALTRVVSLGAQLQAQRKQIDVASAQMRVAQVNLDNTVILAPFSGVVVAKAAQPGEIVSPISAGGGFTRTGICTIVDMDSLEIEVDVNEAYINRVRPQQAVTAVLDAYPEWKVPAAVIAIIPTADRSKATVRVRIALKQKDARIVPDMGVRVSFLQDRPADAPALKGVLVPAAAVVQRDGRTVLFEVDGDRVRSRAVSPGADYGELRLIESGVAEGARIVRNPPADLEDGTRIKLKPAA